MTISRNSMNVKVRKNRKADYRAVDSPKKRTNEFVFSAMTTLHGKKTTNLFVRFWENLWCANLLTVLSDL